MMETISKSIDEEVSHVFRTVLSGLDEIQRLTGAEVEMHKLMLAGKFTKWQLTHVVHPEIDLAAERAQKTIEGMSYGDASHGL